MDCSSLMPPHFRNPRHRKSSAAEIKLNREIAYLECQWDPRPPGAGPGMDGRRTPDIVCLQEIKAAPAQLPVWLCELEGYWATGMAGRATRVSACTSARRSLPSGPSSSTRFRLREPDRRRPIAQVTVASVYVPNGARTSRRRCAFLVRSSNTSPTRGPMVPWGSAAT